MKKFINPESVYSIITKARNVTDAPILIKLPRVENLEIYENILKAISKFNKTGIVIANTKPIRDSRLKVGNGGKSGPPLFSETLKILNYLRPKFKDAVIICSGGVSNFEDAKKLLESGANAIQVYTALIYEGPGIAKKINSQLKNSRLLN